MNYYGQPEAILNWGDTLLGKVRARAQSSLFRFITPFLFGWPHVYLKDVEDIWVNGNVRFSRGQKFISEMKNDWEESTTPVSANSSLKMHHQCHGLGYDVADGKRELACDSEHRHGTWGSQSLGCADR